MLKAISQKQVEKIKSADVARVKNSSERDLLVRLLRLALKDLGSREPALRRSAHWWVFKDESKDASVESGYISFRGVCEALDLDPDFIRRKFKAVASKQRVRKLSGSYYGIRRLGQVEARNEWRKQA